MKFVYWVAFTLLGSASQLGCEVSEDESSSALASFEASPCKKHGVLVTDLASGEDGADAGSEPAPPEPCVEYTLNDGTLAIRLTDFPGACGMPWGGEVALDGQTLVLQGKNIADGCVIARCSDCQYDLEFMVSGVQSARALPVRIELGECADGSQESDIDVYELTLPVDEQAQHRSCGDFDVSTPP